MRAAGPRTQEGLRPPVGARSKRSCCQTSSSTRGKALLRGSGRYSATDSRHPPPPTRFRAGWPLSAPAGAVRRREIPFRDGCSCPGTAVPVSGRRIPIPGPLFSSWDGYSFAGTVHSHSGTDIPIRGRIAASPPRKAAIRRETALSVAVSRPPRRNSAIGGGIARWRRDLAVSRRLGVGGGRSSLAEGYLAIRPCTMSRFFTTPARNPVWTSTSCCVS